MKKIKKSTGVAIAFLTPALARAPEEGTNA